MLSAIIWPTLALTEVLSLLLHLAKSSRESAHDALVGHLVDVGLDEESKVEDELIAHVLGVRDDDRVPKDGVLPVGGVYGYVAVAEGLTGDDVLVQNVEVDERSAGCGRVAGGGDATRRRLGDNLGA